jgi:hypothetical protein
MRKRISKFKTDFKAKKKKRILRTKTYVRHKEKRCYGTDEWSPNKICYRCKWFVDCGAVHPKLQWGE